MIRTALILSTMVSVIAGCSDNANYTSIFRTKQLSEVNTAQTTLIDAKQRALFTTPGGFDDFESKRQYIVCAEPSPDAVSALSSAFSLNFQGTDSERLAIAKSLSEAVARLGKRNATIQLLRDGLYRQCEAYMNGMISRYQHIEIIGRYVDAMVTLLAIEQVTSPTAGDDILPSVRSYTNASVVSEAIPASDDTASGGNAGNEVTDTVVGVEVHATSGRDHENGTDNRSAQIAMTPSDLEVATVDNGIAKEVTKMLRVFLAKDTRDRCLDGLNELFIDGDFDALKERADNVVVAQFLKICETVVRESFDIQEELKKLTGAAR